MNYDLHRDLWQSGTTLVVSGAQSKHSSYAIPLGSSDIVRVEPLLINTNFSRRTEDLKNLIVMIALLHRFVGDGSHLVSQEGNELQGPPSPCCCLSRLFSRPSRSTPSTMCLACMALLDDNSALNAVPTPL
jgi:hypothetical protein